MKIKFVLIYFLVVLECIGGIIPVGSTINSFLSYDDDFDMYKEDDFVLFRSSTGGETFHKSDLESGSVISFSSSTDYPNLSCNIRFGIISCYDGSNVKITTYDEDDEEFTTPQIATIDSSLLGGDLIQTRLLLLSDITQYALIFNGGPNSNAFYLQAALIKRGTLSQGQTIQIPVHDSYKSYQKIIFLRSQPDDDDSYHFHLVNLEIQIQEEFKVNFLNDQLSSIEAVSAETMNYKLPQIGLSHQIKEVGDYAVFISATDDSSCSGCLLVYTNDLLTQLASSDGVLYTYEAEFDIIDMETHYLITVSSDSETHFYNLFVSSSTAAVLIRCTAIIDWSLSFFFLRMIDNDAVLYTKDGTDLIPYNLCGLNSKFNEEYTECESCESNMYNYEMGRSCEEERDFSIHDLSNQKYDFFHIYIELIVLFLILSQF